MDDTTPTTTVKIRTPADILGVLPHRVGFQPEESLVVLSLHGPRRREGLVMRLDLPDPRHDAALCDAVLTRLIHVSTDEAIVVCYSEADPPPSGLLRAPLVRRLRRELKGAGIGMPEALLVRGGRWHSYVCTEPSCCPPEGVPLDPVPTPAAATYAAEAVARGAVVLGSRAELAATVEGTAVGGDTPAVVDEVGRSLIDVLLRLGRSAMEEFVLTTVHTLAERWADGRPAMTTAEAMTVALGVRGKVVRDRVMTVVLDHEPDLLCGVFADVARRTPDELAAPVCSVLAWSAYSAGHGALAAVAAERALRVEPGYTMAELVLDGLARMVAPKAIREISAQVRADLDAGVVWADGLQGYDSLDCAQGRLERTGEAS